MMQPPMNATTCDEANGITTNVTQKITTRSATMADDNGRALQLTALEIMTL
jgi:hypothetical protein